MELDRRGTFWGKVQSKAKQLSKFTINWLEQGNERSGDGIQDRSEEPGRRVL